VQLERFAYISECAAFAGFFSPGLTISYIVAMNDRRTAPRIPVAVYLSQHVEGDTHRCFVTDISSGGLYMERPIGSFVRRSARVQLEIPLPDQPEPIWAAGEIVYDCFDALFHGTAVRFTNMSAQDQARLGAFLAGSRRGAAAA
jgi:hypothetical protein